jgi:hypothetical protein
VTRPRPAVGRGAALAVAVRPDLWPTAVRTAVRLCGPGWWHRWPPGLRPPAAYEDFRRQTMYGPTDPASMSGPELVAFLEWCRRMQALR